MRKYLFFAAFLLFLCMQVLKAQYITLSSKKLYNGSSVFNVKGVNYIAELFAPPSDSTVGTITDIQIRRCHSFYPQNHYMCVGQTACDADIVSDFLYIRDSLKCNTIRLCVSTVGLNNSNCSSVSAFDVQIADDSSGHSFHKVTTDIRFIIPAYKHALDLAATCSLKVILLLPGKPICATALDTPYQNFIAAVGDSLKTKTALLAYDEYNEPQWNNLNVTSTKQQVCAYTSNWYSILKTHDPNHLITIGLGETGLGIDANTWSPDVCKADFYAFHIYPLVSYYQHSIGGSVIKDSNTIYNNLTAYNERYNTVIQWIHDNSNIAWLIGETGFTAPQNPNTTVGDPQYYKKADGDVSHQASYLTNAYTQTVKEGGMGTIWWLYKDTKFDGTTGDFYGLLTSNANPPTIKAAGKALALFDPTTVSGAPTGYPSDYQNLIGYTGTQVSGVVLDQNGAGVTHAAVGGRSMPTWNYYTQTLADASGNFTITSVTPPNPLVPKTTAINRLEISAVGYNVVICDTSWGSSNCESRTFNLTQAVGNIHIDPAQYIAINNNATVTAPSELILQNFYVQRGTGSPVYEHDFTGGTSVTIMPGGYVELGAPAAFYIASAGNFTCNDWAWSYDPLERKANTGQGNNTPAKGSLNATVAGATDLVNAKTIYLTAESYILKVYPNPSTESITIQSAKSITYIEITNMYGAVVLQSNINKQNNAQVNISSLAAGSYMLKIQNDDNTISFTQITKLNN